MKKKVYGCCRICGQETALSFEHIPPKSALNNQRIKQYTGKEAIRTITEDNRMPWDSSNLIYEQQQSGSGISSLCEKCNRYTGTWYGNEYKKLAIAVHSLMMEHSPNAGEVIYFGCRELSPLPIIKQVLSMFCSLNEKLHEDKELTDFLLNKDSTQFNFDKYKVYMYLFKEGLQRRNGFLLNFDIIENTMKTIPSEICAYPFGFILWKEGCCNLVDEGMDISQFAKHSYNDKCNVEFYLPVHECNSAVSLDCRTKEQVAADIIKNKEFCKGLLYGN